MKKNISILVFTIIAGMLIISANITVFARHGNSHNRNSTAKYSVCVLEDCVKTRLHTHKGTTYTAHYYGDGHEYHDYCTVEECTLDGYHYHDETYCFGHTINDGHDYHEYCNIDNCQVAGYHDHDGTYCFAHTSNDGHNHGNAHSCHR